MTRSVSPNDCGLLSRPRTDNSKKRRQAPYGRVRVLRQSTAKSKVVILLTDGVNNAGSVEPRQAAELAASQRIKVYCIGAGTDGLAPFPVIDPFTGRQQLQPTHVIVPAGLIAT